MRTPIASPDHQTHHASAKPVAPSPSDNSSAHVPIVALIAMVSGATMTSLTASRNRLSCGLKCSRRKSKAHRIGAMVFPTAIIDAVHQLGVIGRLTSTAAIAIAGHWRNPKAKKATTATPVGGQSGVTVSCTSESSSPSCADP